MAGADRSGRGGFCSYDWLENLRGLEIHSADRILAEHRHQHLAAGDRIRVAPRPTGPVIPT